MGREKGMVVRLEQEKKYLWIDCTLYIFLIELLLTIYQFLYIGLNIILEQRMLYDCWCNWKECDMFAVIKRNFFPSLDRIERRVTIYAYRREWDLFLAREHKRGRSCEGCLGSLTTADSALHPSDPKCHFIMRNRSQGVQGCSFRYWDCTKSKKSRNHFPFCFKEYKIKKNTCIHFFKEQSSFLLYWNLHIDRINYRDDALSYIIRCIPESG